MLSCDFCTNTNHMEMLSLILLLCIAGLILAGMILPVEFHIADPEDPFEDERAMYEESLTDIHAAGKAASTSAI